MNVYKVKDETFSQFKTETFKMCRLSVIFYGFAIWTWSIEVHGGAQQDWNFVLQRFEYNTSNPEIIDFKLRALRVSPGVYAVNGSIDVGIDVDNSYSVSLILYRSTPGSSQFRATPYAIPETTFYKFMTSIYVKMLQKDLLKCTNFPERANTFESPLEKDLYTLNKCIISNDAMPGHIQPGLYKATGHMIGSNLEASVSVFFDVTTKELY